VTDEGGHMIKNRNFFYASGLFLAAGIWYFRTGSTGLSILFFVVSLMNFYLSVSQSQNKDYDPAALKTLKNDETFKDLIRQGKKAPAVKYVRGVSRCSLMEASKYVDKALERSEKA